MEEAEKLFPREVGGGSELIEEVERESATDEIRRS